MAVAHFAFQLGARHQGGDVVNHQHVDRAGADQRVGDLQPLLAGIGLPDQQVVDIDAELAGIDRVERVFGVDEGADAAALLRLGDGVQSEGGLARAFRAVNFDHTAARQAADAKREVQAERPEGITSICSCHALAPMRMMEPLPKARSICAIAASSALFFSMSGFLLVGVTAASDTNSGGAEHRFCVDVDTTIT